MKYYRLSIHRVLTKQKKETKKILGFIPVSYTTTYEEPITIMTDIIIFDDWSLNGIHVKHLIDIAITRYLVDMNIPEKEHPMVTDMDIGYDNIRVDFQELLFEEIDPLLIYSSDILQIYNQINTWGEEAICPLYSSDKKSLDFLKPGVPFNLVTGSNLDPDDGKVILWMEDAEVCEIEYCIKSNIRNVIFDTMEPRQLLPHILIDEEMMERIKKTNE